MMASSCLGFSLFALFLAVALATSESNTDADRIIFACKGEKQPLVGMSGWEPGPEDAIQHISWFRKVGEDLLTIATLTYGQPLNTSDTRLSYIAPAGLAVSDITVNDTGSYVIVISLLESGEKHLVTEIRNVQVAEMAEVENNETTLRVQDSGMMDEKSGEWFTNLRCGKFLKKGPIVPFVKTPSDRLLELTGYQDGDYMFRLPDKAETGMYVCLLPRRTECPSHVYPAAGLLEVDTGSVKASILQGKLNDVIATAEYQQQIILTQRRDLRRQQEKLLRKQEEAKPHQQEVQYLFEETVRLRLDKAQLERENALLDSRLIKTSASVGFSANSYPLIRQANYPQAIIADNVTLNQGGGYNKTSGVFTAPVSGMYLVTATVTSNTRMFSFWLVVDSGGSQDIPRNSVRSGRVSSMSVQVLLTLNRGQCVWLMANDYQRSYGSVFFTGFLVSPQVSRAVLAM
ncbi:uncharacterized protein [Littorina saxatilis]|uniref:uncharacterized protein n=1 Tax=Littorina saxatilis TaxID=31220 RepID=UPI0038B68F6D